VEEDLVAALADPQRYASPARECDIVMKGGIASGVIYPLAVLLVCWHSSWSSLSKLPSCTARHRRWWVTAHPRMEPVVRSASIGLSARLPMSYQSGNMSKLPPRQQNVWRCRLAPELAATVQRNATAA
jgi:hypothetical protein